MHQRVKEYRPTHHQDHLLKAKNRYPRTLFRPPLLLRQNEVPPGPLPRKIEFGTHNARELHTSSLPSPMKPAPRKSSTDIPFNLSNREGLTEQ